MNCVLKLSVQYAVNIPRPGIPLLSEPHCTYMCACSCFALNISSKYCLVLFGQQLHNDNEFPPVVLLLCIT